MNRSFPNTGNKEDLMDVDVERSDETQKSFEAEFESLSLSDRQSERYAILDLGSSRNSMREYVVGISSLRRLIISYKTLEMIHRYCKLEQLPLFYNLSHLEATFGWEMLAMFLQSCPNLKFLVLNWAHPIEMEKIKLAIIPQCFRSSLEFVEMKRPITGEAGETELIEYLLSKLEVLRKFFIPLGYFPDEEEEFGILKEILWFPRRSCTCQIFHCRSVELSSNAVEP